MIKPCLALCLTFCASTAAAEEIKVQNTGDDPIYKLYVWASDLAPSTESVIVFPILSGKIDTVTIDNDYSDCIFTFQIDRNNPDDLRNPLYQKREMTLTENTICGRKDTDPIPLPQDEKPPEQ